MEKRKSITILIALIILFILTACSGNINDTPDDVISQPPPTSTLEPTPAPTPEPTPTVSDETNNGNDENADSKLEDIKEIDFNMFPRPGGEWALFINGKETDVNIILEEVYVDGFFERYNRYIPFEEVGLLLGASLQSYESEGFPYVSITLNDKKTGVRADGMGFAIEKDSVVYGLYEIFARGLGLFHRTDIDRKILFFDEVEVPWTLYINGSPTDFEVVVTTTRDISNVDVLSYWEFYVQSLKITVPYIEILRYIGAEFRHAPRQNFPNYHDIYYKDVLAGMVFDLGNDNFPPVLESDAISVTIEYGLHRVYILTS